jgi:hypothetical protein
MPASIITGINIHREVVGGSMGVNTIALAPKAPIMNWPSAPIFQSFMRKATEQANADSRIGVAFTIVSESTPTLPKDASAIWA